MQTARLGNDLYGEDPTANELEAAAARLLGKDSAVLMPSGVMANKVALSVLAEPDQLIAVGRCPTSTCSRTLCRSDSCCRWTTPMRSGSPNISGRHATRWSRSPSRTRT